MESNFMPITLSLFIALTLSPLLKAQESDSDMMSKALKQTEEQSKKMGLKVPDMKAQMAEIEQVEAKEKAALQKQLEAPGPVSLPAWTPALPQFTPAGPATKKIIDGQVNIVLDGTSTLTPAELGDVWDAAKTEKMSGSRSNNSFNDTKTVIIHLYFAKETAQEEVRLEATRTPKEKITHLTITSPLPKPEVD
jgi:hypothetical protein